MSSEVKDEVEAALLNSDGEPQEEVRHALEGVALFALSPECELPLDEFLEMAEKAWRKAEAELEGE